MKHYTIWDFLSGKCDIEALIKARGGPRKREVEVTNRYVMNGMMVLRDLSYELAHLRKIRQEGYSHVLGLEEELKDALAEVNLYLTWSEEHQDYAVFSDHRHEGAYEYEKAEN